VADDGADFVLGGGRQDVLLACRHAAGLGQLLPQVLALLAEGVGDVGQGVDQDAASALGDELHERHQEGDRLLGEVRRADLGSGHPQVVADLVDHDEGGVVADQLLPDLRPRRRPLLVAPADDLVAGLLSDLVGDLAPERVGTQAAVVDPVGDLHVRADDAGDLADRLGRHEFRRNELGDELRVEANSTAA